MNGLEKPKRVKNRKVLENVRQQRCVVSSGCMGHIEPHHVTTKGASGGDTPGNIMPLCTSHHHMWHMQGPSRLVRRFPVVRRWLEAHERWDVLEKLNKLQKPSDKGGIFIKD